MNLELKNKKQDSSWANNKVKARKLSKHNKYYVNFDYKFFTGLTRKQIAFLFLIHKLNRANLIATNKEIEAAIGVRFDHVKDLYQNINRKFPGLIKITYEKVNRFGKIVDQEKDNYTKRRVIRLTRELHIKGEAYQNMPAFTTVKKSCFMSSNEIKVLAYLSAMPNKSFNGYLRVIINKLEITYGILKRALLKLTKIKAIFKRSIPIKQKLKNIYYTINTIKINTNWSYNKIKTDSTVTVKRKIPNDSEEDSWKDDWDKLLEIGI